MNRRILAIVLCLALLLSLYGCGQSSAPAETTAAPTEASTAAPTEATTVPTEPPASDLYAQAKAPLLEAENLELLVTAEKTVSVGGETFRLNTEQTIRFNGIGTDALQVALTETQKMNGNDDKFEEYFESGTLYLTVSDEYRFKGAMEEAEYLARFAPAVLLEESLYAEITAAQDGENTLIQFQSPTAGEAWALPEGAQFQSATGTALIDGNGNLTQTSYTVSYTYGGSQISETVTAAAAVTEAFTLTAPEDSAYTELEHVDAIRLYDMAVLYLCSTNTVTTNLTETIASQAAAYVLATQNTVNFYGKGKNHVSEVTYSASATQENQTDTYQQTERYQNGIYSIAVDGGDPQKTTNVDAATMLTYCSDFLYENLLSLEYISSATVSEVGGTLYLELGCSEAYGQWLCEYTCTTLFDDANLLNDLATAYTLSECSAYLAVNKYTGMPTATGIAYSATHTIEGSDYILALQADQSFYLASQTAYETVTGKSLPESAPENTATPLFYKVTGSDGQQMYLFGTIHLGDARTAYLPQEIYDAFNSADALAVEFDTLAYEESMASSPEESAQILSLYLYTDGTTTKDHLDEDVYDAAIKLLKASGNYSAYTEVMKPSIWESSISNFYIQQNYGLSSDKGMDVRLLKLAKEQGMEIRDVESALSQVSMLTGYSDKLQEYLLEQTVFCDASAYYQSVVELYELWCQGDEDALRAAIADDTSDMSQEETELYDEYQKAMSTDRNAKMVQVAVDYLESGDTVFYAVGLAHLLAEDGLVDMLRAAGYTVELVPFN